MSRLLYLLVNNLGVQVAVIVAAILGIFFGVESYLEGERQTRWQQTDAAWEARDTANQERVVTMLEDIQDSCGESE